MPVRVFRDRRDAGKQLAVKVAEVADPSPLPHALIVLGLPRGGVPVAYEVATLLGIPLDVLPVRKLGLPGFEEYAVGAIAAVNGDPVVFIEETARPAEIEAQRQLDDVVRRQWSELLRRRRAYRGTRPTLQLEDQDVILVDDGLATGATMLAAVRAVRRARARRIITAVPVVASDAYALVAREADVCCHVVQTENLHAVGMWYEDFSPTSDLEVVALLAEAERRRAHRLPSR